MSLPMPVGSATGCELGPVSRNRLEANARAPHLAPTTLRAGPNPAPPAMSALYEPYSGA